MEVARINSLIVPPAGAHLQTAQGYDPVLLAAALRLSLTQGRILSLLLSRPLTTLLAIEDCAGCYSEGRRALIHRMRFRLQRSKVRIISHNGLGYSIPEEDRGRVSAIIENFRSI